MNSPSIAPTPTPEPILTVQQLKAAILQEAGLDMEEMDALRRTVRVPGWEVEGAAPPFRDTHVIEAMFVGSEGDRTDDHLAGDIRAYARPRVFNGPAEDRAPFFRFVLNRNSQAIRTDAMNLQSFVEDVGHEYAQLVVEDDDDDEPDPACTACGVAIDEADAFCPKCGIPVRICRAPSATNGTCGYRASLAHKFCAECGMPLPPPPTARKP